MSQITTHVLDAALGSPAAGVMVVLQMRSPEGWSAVGKGETDVDGRVPDLGPESVAQGIYRLIFATGDYFAASDRPTFYPEVVLAFEVTGPEAYHVPLLLSPFAYSTYRGS
jgi:5-hydroxyisourate hydrolase